MKRRMNGRTKGGADECIDRGMVGRTNGWVDDWTDGEKSGWMGGRMDVCMCTRVCM